MWHFDTNNELYTETKTYLAALASADCFSTYEQARLSALYAKMASSATMVAAGTAWRRADSNKIVWAVATLMSRKWGAND
jgi:hypothetical protein